MRHAHESRWKGIFYSSLFLIGILGALGFMTLAFARAYYEHYKIEQEIAELKKNKERLEAKKLETLELLEYVQSPGFIEQKARTELSMSRPGERVVIVTAPTPTSTGQSPTDMVQEEDIGNPMRWWRYFFHKK